ncbi:PIG-L family deacetylase [Conexibacter sp. JD483]|uniref:PIG-L deacetylase family protein n=1 Tax=unclassified Conexibacter TaxID=2627773 RepID=UPI0027250E83|nr:MULTISPECIES: PIG-L family deacetylase [unclassified Conexibacter]MDO8186575.1 PIG-L family deacetylase [Conexibacter sp. CPCC 205706]MDO8196680.1 PIG-L family deacetylase [Conexibacter sp. CPCC 205762]MDR9372054.1 PIG-L family deacetylase [Conexibacter sp. JD483]
MRIACVFAHQDDEKACLATLLRLRAERGAEIAFIATTNGDKGMSWDPSIPLAEAAVVREREMSAVAAALGGSYVCLGEPDQFLFDAPRVRLALIEALRAAAPDLIFTHNPAEYSVDHDATARLTTHAALMTTIASVETNSPALARVPAIFHCDPGPGHGFDGTHFVTFDEAVADKKARIVRLHDSQMAVMRELRGVDYADLQRDADRQTGARLVQPYAEVFRPCLMERRIPTASLLP